MARSPDGGDLDFELIAADAAPPADADEVLVAGGDGLLERVGSRFGSWRWTDLRPRTRRVLVGAGACAVLVAAAIVVQSHQAPSSRRATPPAPVPSAQGTLPGLPVLPSSIPSLAYTVGPPGAPPPGEGYALRTLPTGKPIDLAISSTSLYVLLDNEVVVVDAYSGEIVRAASVAAGPYSRLVLDDADGVVWVVTNNPEERSAVVHRLDTATLTEQPAVTVPATVYDAATLDGRLFIATSMGIEELTPGAGALTPVMATNPPAEVLAADAVNDTVYALTSGPTGGLIALSPDGNTQVAGPPLGISQPSLAIVGAALWVGGVGAKSAVTRVDPNSMLPVPSVATVTAAVGADAEVEAGANDIWVYSPSTSRLYCIDQQTGQDLQHWDQLSGPVTAGGSGPYAVGRGQVWPLVLRGACRG